MTPLASVIIDESTAPCCVQPLAALLAHPEFMRGLTDAHEEFLGSFEPVPLTEDEMVEEIEMNVGYAITQRSRKLNEAFGWEPPSYLYNLGFAIGIINEGLSYA